MWRLGCVILGGLSVVARGSQNANIGIDGQAVVTIRGGVDATGHHYTWTIQTRDPSPIVYVEIPHYRADLFTPPQGWTRLDPTPDIEAAVADSVKYGIKPGRPGVFRMRIRAAGASQGTGTVRVRFADGTEAAIGGVTLPQPPSDKNVGLIGLAALFAVWVAVRIYRRKRGNTETRKH